MYNTHIISENILTIKNVLIHHLVLEYPKNAEFMISTKKKIEIEIHEDIINYY